jgi:class 3 adenylate cyclase
VKCPKCNSKKPNTAKYCSECGTCLDADTATPAVHQSDDHTALLQKYIPPELAKKILSAGTLIESERRLVTVLFADVSGFTAMSEKLDAEEVTTVINDCFKGLISIVYRYEGVIDKFIGDEIMAIFGAPITHENDSERAVRCASEMMEYMERFNMLSPIDLPEPLGLHISMNTGMVVAGNIGSDLRMNYSVIGDTVNLASRLKHFAEGGEIALSEETYRIVSGLVEVHPPQRFAMKGKLQPVNVYKMIALKSGNEPGVRITQKNPIVGRMEEIARLQESLQSVSTKREGRVYIRGEAGVGKTRLKLELMTLAEDMRISVYEGKCSSFEIHTPYYLWTTMLKDILRLKVDTVESEMRKRLHDMLQILSLEQHEPYLATLLSLRYEEIVMEDDQSRKRKMYDAVKEFLRALTERKLSVFVFEDIHWIDRFSQDLLMYLLAERELAPALFVSIFRDEYRHAKELMHQGGLLIDLNRLSITDAVELIKRRCEASSIPEELTGLIYKRSEGNPFFIEELVKTLFDKKSVEVKDGILQLRNSAIPEILPETIQGVIMARIDRLEEKLKEVLYGASVIGREFDRNLLKEILKKKDAVDPSLQELISLELILEKEETKELAYLFKHYLIQEVAYNTILQKRRRLLHKTIAQAIEKVYTDKIKEFYELLAFHYERAEEWEKAANYLSLAGRKAEEIFTKSESTDFSLRRADAVKKLYSSESAKRPLLTFFLRALTLLISIPMVFSMLVSVVLLIVKAKYSFSVFTFFFTIPFIAFLTFSVILLAGIIFFGSYNIAFKKRIALFDILDDRINIQQPDGVQKYIMFDEIVSIQKFNFVDIKTLMKKRFTIVRTMTPGYGITQFCGLPVSLTWQMNRKDTLIGSVFGISSKEGYVSILKQSGLSYMERFIRPWSQLYPLRSQIVSLSPGDPGIFLDHLSIALQKWRTKGGKQKIDTVQRSQLSLRSEFSYWSYFIPLFPGFLYFIAYGILLILALLFSNNEAPEGVVPILSLLMVIGVSILVIPLSVKKQIQRSRFEFAGNELIFDYGLRDTIPGKVSFSNISQVNLIKKFPQKMFGRGTIEILLLTPLKIAQYKNPLSAIYITNIKNADDAYVKIKAILT